MKSPKVLAYRRHLVVPKHVDLQAWQLNCMHAAESLLALLLHRLMMQSDVYLHRCIVQNLQFMHPVSHCAAIAAKFHFKACH